MLSISAEIYFEDGEIMQISSSSCWDNKLGNWALTSNDVFYKYNFERVGILNWNYRMSAEDFLTFIDKNIDEFEENLKARSGEHYCEWASRKFYNDFYKKLEYCNIKHIDFELIDQS